jgi:hypothetical protein
MRVLLLPTVMVGVLAMTGSDEPSETAMRQAFAATLSAEVESALAFVAETGGPEALARVRQAGTDEFDIRAFTKLDCAPGGPKPGHVCAFAVSVGVVSGVLQRRLTGRFYAGPQGLVFDNEEPSAAGA